MEGISEENSTVISTELSVTSDEAIPIPVPVSHPVVSTPTSAATSMLVQKASNDGGDIPTSCMMDDKEMNWESGEGNKNTGAENILNSAGNITIGTGNITTGTSPEEKLETELITQNAKSVQSREVCAIVEANDASVANLKAMECCEKSTTDQTENDINTEEALRSDPPGDDGAVFSMVTIGENMEADKDASSSSEDDSSDFSDDSSDSSDDDTSSNDCCDMAIRRKEIDLAEEIATLKDTEPLKVKGEILANELPPVKELDIALPSDVVLEPVGKIAHIMNDYSVIIHSYSGRPALDIETILFLSRLMAIGKVAETFGPVPSPYYTVRFNSQEHLNNACVELDKEVFYAPHIQDFTSYVFVSELRKLRGSDASWCNDTEPPASCLDYSDDEREREAKRKPKSGTANGESGTNKGNAGMKRPRPGHQNNHRGRGRGRGRWHNEPSRHVAPGPDPSQIGWQTAISGVPRHAFPQPFMPLRPDLMTCFQRPPPPDMPGCSYRSFGCPPPPSVSILTHFPQQHSAVRWNRPPPPYFQSSACDFGLPPPPPPPP